MNSFDHRKIVEEIYKENEDFLNLLLEKRDCDVGDFFDRMKEPITPAEWIILRDQKDYYLIAEDLMDDWHVFTEWCGYDAPHIFRTQISYVEPEGSDIILYPQMRFHYTSEKSATHGHNKMVFCIDQKMIRVIELD